MRSTFALLCLWAIVAIPPAWAVDAEPPIEDPGEKALYDELLHEVRCLVCQNQAVGDSTAPLAADLRREIRRMVLEGKSESDIKTFLLERYGDFILYRPQFKATTALLWLAPLLLLLIGAVALGRVLRRRAELPADVDADENVSTPENPRS